MASSLQEGQEDKKVSLVPRAPQVIVPPAAVAAGAATSSSNSDSRKEIAELGRIQSGLEGAHMGEGGVPNTPPKGGQLLGFCAVDTRSGAHSTSLTPPTNLLSDPPEMGSLNEDIDTHTDLTLPVIVCGPMGAGKTALLQRLIENSKEQVEQCASVVAYDRRFSQREHKNTLQQYEMVSIEAFREMERNNEFMENFSDTQRKICFGIRHEEVTRIQDAGRTPVIDMDQRALPRFVNSQIQARYVYILPPSESELEFRLNEMRVMKKSVSHKERQSAFQEYSKREEIISLLKDTTKDHPTRLFLLENNEYDLAYTQLQHYVLNAQTLTPSQAIALQHAPAPLHGVTIIVEPSGIGGSTYINRLREEGVGVAVSHTTREQKPGEKAGKHYHFVPVLDFRRKCLLREFLEYAQVGGHYYGTTKQEFRRVLATHSHVVIKVNVRGARSVKSVQIGARFVLLSCGDVSATAPERRLRWEAKEGPLSEEEVSRRETILNDEMADARELPFCDLVVDISKDGAYERLRDFVVEGKSQRNKKDTRGHLKVPREEADEIVRKRSGTLRTGTVMKADHFPSGKQRGLKEYIEGAPNFRHVADGPDPCGTRHQHAFFGMAQPTYNGMLSVLMRILRNRGHTKALVVNLREERVLYINGNPFCLKNLQDLYHNVEDEISVSPERIEAQEEGLKSGIVSESKDFSGGFLVHDEEYAQGELAAFGETFAYHEIIKDRSSVLTPRQVVEEASDQMSASGASVRYVRLPITDEQPPKDEDLDTLVKEFWRLHLDSPGAPIVFNCQLGRGRTTTAMLLCLLFLFPPQQIGGDVGTHPLRDDLGGNFDEDKDKDKDKEDEETDDSGFQRMTDATPYARSGSIVGMEGERCATESERETRWLCVRTLFDDYLVPHLTEMHFLRVIDATDHIQNLRLCVRETYDKCAKPADPADPEKRQKLWKKMKNYLRRYYYLAMAATYFETQCVGKYRKWRRAVNHFSSENASLPDTASPPTSPNTDPITSPECVLEVPPMLERLDSTQHTSASSKRERRSTSSHHSEDYLRVGFKLWVNAEGLWNRCDTELNHIKEELGIETPEEERNELEHSGQVTRIENDGRGVWIAGKGLGSDVFAPIELIRNLSTPVFKHQDASAAAFPPPLSLSPTPAELHASFSLSQSTGSTSHKILSQAFCGMHVRFSVAYKDVTKQHTNGTLHRVASKVLRDPSSYHISPPLHPQEADASLHSPLCYGQGHHAPLAGWCSSGGDTDAVPIPLSGSDLNTPLYSDSAGPCLERLGMHPTLSSVSLTSTGGACSATTTPLYRGGTGGEWKDSGREAGPRFEAVFYEAGSWQALCAALVIWHVAPHNFHAYAVPPESDAHIRFFRSTVEKYWGEGGEETETPQTHPLGFVPHTQSPVKRKRRSKILVIGRRLQGLLQEGTKCTFEKGSGFTCFAEHLPGHERDDDQRVAADKKLTSVWEGPTLVTIAWEYVRLKWAKAMTWSSLPPFLSYVDATQLKKKPAEVCHFMKGLEHSEWASLIAVEAQHPMETRADVFVQLDEALSAVNFVMRLIEEGQTHLGLESGSGRAADDAEEEEEEVEELVEELEMREDGAAAEEQLAEMMEDLLVQS